METVRVRKGQKSTVTGGQPYSTLDPYFEGSISLSSPSVYVVLPGRFKVGDGLWTSTETYETSRPRRLTHSGIVYIYYTMCKILHIHTYI